jgi:uncharacterized protein YrzB (UPF0473 family)
MTTFMRVLALYESKVHEKNVLITPSNWTMNELNEIAISDMQRRLGKSVKDGVVRCSATNIWSDIQEYDYQFNMDDGQLSSGNKYSKNVYSFGTRERRYCISINIKPRHT